MWLRCQEKLEQNKQLPNRSSGKHSWLTGLLKCGGCGYAIKIIADSSGGRRYRICSGRANMASCTENIKINLDELEAAVADKLREFLDQCPGEELSPAGHTAAQEIPQIDVKIGRLVNALAESSAVSVPYINAQIEKLHRRRKQLSKELQSDPGKGGQTVRIDFDHAAFEEKKIIAREFIEKILLKENSADVIWKI